MTQPSAALLGVHVSIRGGIENAPQRGRALGCNVIQIFSKNQRQWECPPLQQNSVEKFKEALTESGILETVVHDSYLINPASPDPVLRARSEAALADEIDRAVRLDAGFLVVHPGAHKGSGPEEGIRRIAESLNRCMDRPLGNRLMLLLENTAGQGTSIGSRFEELADIISRCGRRDRLGICLDTAHAFAAGYDLRSRASVRTALKRLDEAAGIDRLRVFHLNDSKKPLQSRRDRHENIGKGVMGLEGFEALMNDPRFRNCPKILETPGGDLWFKKNLKRLRSMIT